MQKAKFKILWRGRVKNLAIADKQTLRFFHAQKTDEGFNSIAREYTRTGSTITKKELYRGCDCDGPFQEVTEHKVSIYELRYYPRFRGNRPYWPNWQLVDDECYDAFAQQMGY